MRRLRSVVASLAAMAIATSGTVLAAAPASASPDKLPFTFTNDTDQEGPLYLYTVGINLDTDELGSVDGDGNFTAWPDGAAPPAPAPDVSIPGPASGASGEVKVPKNFSGRMYFAFGNKLDFRLTEDGGLVQPAPWAEGDPNYGTLLDWSEFTYNDSGLFLNSSQVDMFALPHTVSVTDNDGNEKSTGATVPGGRDSVIDGLTDAGWGDSVITGDDGEVLRVLSPGKASDAGRFDETYLDSYINTTWETYASKPLTVVPFGDQPDLKFIGRTNGNTMVFTEGEGGPEVASFEKPSTANVWGCDGALQAPNDLVVGPIARTLCAALVRGNLDTVDQQPSLNADEFYKNEDGLNYYGKLVHESMLDGKAYAFAFDDVGNFESLVTDGNPSAAAITLDNFAAGGNNVGGESAGAGSGDGDGAGDGSADGGDLQTSDTPDFGDSVTIFDPASTDVQGQVDAAFDEMLLNPASQFGDQRDTFLFKPGSYDVFANLGFYTTVAGLGLNPDDVTLNGNINVDAGWNAGDETNATQNFWRSAENLSVVPEGGTTRWAVSQAAPMRRVHVKGNMTMGPSNQDVGQGYASGGYLADSKVDGGISSGSQQQWYTRNSSLGSWEGGVWNMVFSGVDGAPEADNAHTVLDSTPTTKEKPYLYIDDAGNYSVFVPELAQDASGATWPDTPGDSVPLSKFYVAKPGDSAATINQALDQGLNLFFTPGVYDVDETINVTNPDTIIYGLGFPTLVPQGGVDAMAVADTDGVNISGLLFDAGSENSENLLTVGEEGVHYDHAADPTVLADTYFRVGGPRAGKATNSLVVHSDDTVVDHTWIWRGDHGEGIGWDQNTADTGIIVNGDDVLATGLFVEHYQRYEAMWNGEGGKTIFFQNEMPYDVPSQGEWESPTGAGYASYKVADDVKTHELFGGGAYTFFNVDPSVRADRGFEVPETPGVKLTNVFTVSLGDVGGITHVVNNTGGAVPNPEGNTVPQYVPSFP